VSKPAAIAIAVIAATAAALAPFGIALYLARQQALQEEMARAGQLAEDVLRRSDETGDQVLRAFSMLDAVASSNPCSDESIQVMASLAVASEQVQAIGYVKDDRLMCSSLGRYGAGVSVGPSAYRGRFGTDIRPSVELPMVRGKRFVLLTDARSGYTAIVHPDLPIDVFVNDPQISLGVFGYSSKKLLTSRGTFKPQWAQALGEARRVELDDGEYVVAIRRSDNYDTAAFAAIPSANIDQGLLHNAIVLVPIGALAGVVLATAVLYIAKLQRALPAMLKAALRRNEFFLSYQPIVELRTGKWVGAEALIRWRRSSGEMVRPDIFIPVAEDTGLIQQITERVVEIIGREAAGLFERYPHFHIAINLSSLDLQSKRIVEVLRLLASRTSAGAGNVVVEATERGFMKSDVVREVLREIRASGMRVAIDDFGTGYSSLSYLHSFELDILKIDKSFVDTIGTDAATSHVVLHIIEMAKDLHLEMIAEGVESEAQAQFLRERGVQYAQGWLFAKAMAFSDLVSQLDKMGFDASQ